MTLTEFLGIVGLFLGTAIGFGWGWGHGWLWAVAGAVVGAPVGFVTGVISAFGYIILEDWLSTRQGQQPPTTQGNQGEHLDRVEGE